jgi:hypothetical protein
MLILLALTVIAAVSAMHHYLQAYAPSNLLVRRARAMPPPWRAALTVTAVAGVLLTGMHVLAAAAASGAPGWVNLVVLILAWDAIKVGLLAVSVIARCTVRAVRPAGQGPAPPQSNRMAA